MTGNHKSGKYQSRWRCGFTLVEILVVITIIVLLAALTLRIVGGVMANAKTAATSALLSKIQGRLNDRTQSLSAVDMTQYNIQAANDSSLSLGSPTEVEVVAKKILYKEAFPQTWEEFNDLWPEVWMEIRTDQLAKAGGSGSASDPPVLPTTDLERAAESSEVLYALITRAPIVGKGKRKLISGVAGVQADEFNSQDIGDTDGDGLPEFIDAWGQPLRFYRWPTRLIRPDGSGAVITQAQLETARTLIPNLPSLNYGVSDQVERERPLKDADDPFRAMLSFSDFENIYHTPDTYSVPLVVSAGPDEKLGLREPVELSTNTTYFGHLAQMGFGTDGQPGLAGMDDDSNSTVDDDTELGWPGSDELEELYDNLTNLNNRPAGN